MKKLLIIDSNSILNRAYYGIRYLSNKENIPTNAIYGFLNILIKLCDEQKPDYIAAAFDLKAPTFRHKMYKEYKAQRKSMPDDLVVQMPLAKEILTAMNIKILEIEGYEADDIIGTVSRICEEKDVECMIATGDKDDLQLASDKTKVILTVTRNGNNETTIYDDKAVFEKYRVTPNEFIDVKALMGDTSDNIPGVAGIGEKTAMSLIEKHKSIEFIYENIDEIGLKGAMLEKLKNGKEMAFLSKTLSTINKDVPIDFSVEECSLKEKTLSKNAGTKFLEILKRLELYSIIKRLNLEDKEEKEIKTDFFKTLNMEFLTDNADIEKVIKKAEKEKKFAFLIRNTELAISFEKETFGIELNEEKISIIKSIFENKDIEKTTFDAKEVYLACKNIFDVFNISFDVALSAYLIDPAKSRYNISDLTREYMGVDISSGEKMQMSLFDEEDKTLLKECATLLELEKITKELLEKEGQIKLYKEVELPLSKVLADMQYEGITIDQKQLSDFSDMLGERIKTLTEEIYKISDEEFNINSPKQLGVVLFEKLGLKAIKKTKSGYSTNADVLEKLKDKHEIIPLIMEYRALSKLKSTYCDGFFAVIDKDDSKIHSNFTQTVTVTGRISSTEPNMQNIPVRTPLGREMRKMFVAKEGNLLIDADYSQIELRVLAHIANDEKMIHAFLNDEDIHTVTASQVLGIAQNEVTPEQRSSAKAVNFGIVYGMGEFSLSEDLKISIKAAKEYIANYLEKYSGVREYMKMIKQKATEDGVVKTLMNRVRYIPELRSSNHNIRAFGERVALNTPIQGTAADIIKLAMVRVHKRLEEEKMKTKLILQVHDELILEAPIGECEKASKILKEEMENSLNLKVPLKVDLKTGKSWYDAK